MTKAGSNMSRYSAVPIRYSAKTTVDVFGGEIRLETRYGMASVHLWASNSTRPSEGGVLHPVTETSLGTRQEIGFAGKSQCFESSATSTRGRSEERRVGEEGTSR